MSNISSKLEPADSKIYEIPEINVLQKFSPNALDSVFFSLLNCGAYLRQHAVHRFKIDEIVNYQCLFVQVGGSHDQIVGNRPESGITLMKSPDKCEIDRQLMMQLILMENNLLESSSAEQESAEATLSVGKKSIEKQP